MSGTTPINSVAPLWAETAGVSLTEFKSQRCVHWFGVASDPPEGYGNGEFV